MPSAYPMLARCARYQLREDPPLYDHLLARQCLGVTLRPNLLLITAPRRPRHPGDEHGTLVPMLCLKAG